MASSSTPLRAPAPERPPGLPTIPRLPNGDEDTDELRRMIEHSLANPERYTHEEVWAEILGDLPDDDE